MENKQIIIIFFVVAAALLFLNWGYVSDKVDLEQPKEDALLTPHFVKDNVFLTVVGQESGITGVFFTVRLENTGEIPLVVTLDTATPDQLNQAFNFPETVLNPGQTKTWTSGVIPTLQFESITGQKTRFNVKLKQVFDCPLGTICVQSDGTKINPGESGILFSEGSVEILFEPETAKVGSKIDFGAGTGDSGSGVQPDPEDPCLSKGSSCVKNDDCCSGVCCGGTCIEGECFIDCYTDSDCGVSGYVGDNFCSNNNVVRLYRTYKCHNPGTVDAYCSSSTTEKLVKTCGSLELCQEGVCVPQQEVVFRTNSAGNYKLSGTEIAFDYTGDGNLDCFVYSSFYSGYTSTHPVILGYTPQGYAVHSYTLGRVIIRYGDNPIFSPGSCGIPLVKYPVEPYASQGKEVYK